MFWVHWLFRVTSRCVKWYRVVVSEQFYEYMSTVSGPNPRVAFGIVMVSVHLYPQGMF